MNNFFLNYLDVNANKVFINPDSNMSIEDFVKNELPVNTHYVLLKKPYPDINFRSCYTGDFSLPTGSTSPYIVDMTIAKEIFLDFLRNARIPLFSELDVQFMRALEQGNQSLSTEIGGKKQVLRDITTMDLSTATDLETLKLLWPTEILGPSPFKNK